MGGSPSETFKRESRGTPSWTWPGWLAAGLLLTLSGGLWFRPPANPTQFFCQTEVAKTCYTVELRGGQAQLLALEINDGAGPLVTLATEEQR